MIPVVDPKTAADVTIAGVNLATAIVEIITRARKAGEDLDAAEIIGAVIQSTRRTTRQLREEIEALQENLAETKLDIDRPLDEILQDWRFWKGKKYRALDDYQKKVTGLINALGSLHSAVLASAQCKNQEELVMAAL